MADLIDQFIKLTKLQVLDQNKSLDFLKQKTSLRPSQAAFIIIVFLSILLIIAQTSNLTVGVSCFVFPAYFTILNLGRSNHSKDAKYLTYWVIFSILQLTSFIFKWVFGPTLYAVQRVIVTVLLLHPQTQLSLKLYNQVIQPLITKLQSSPTPKLHSTKSQDKFDRIANETKKQFMEFNKKYN